MDNEDCRPKNSEFRTPTTLGPALMRMESSAKRSPQDEVDMFDLCPLKAGRSTHFVTLLLLLLTIFKNGARLEETLRAQMSVDFGQASGRNTLANDVELKLKEQLSSFLNTCIT